MKITHSPYRGYRFPPEIISYCVWLYFRFSVSYRDIEELMAERGVTVTYESIRAWCYKFGRDYAKRIRTRGGMLGDTWHLDGFLQRKFQATVQHFAGLLPRMAAMAHRFSVFPSKRS
jgi:transposase-like protein